MIIDRLNWVYWLIVLFVVCLIIGIYFLLRNKNLETKKIVISTICICDIIFFFIYKYWLSIDPLFLKLNNLDKFNWWNELPLQLCNISMFLIPISLLTDQKFLKGFCFFISPLGAFMAISFPEPAFVGDSIFVLRNIGFYVTHIVLVVCGVSLVTLGLYQPKYKEIILPTITAFGLAVVMFLVNTILRNSVCKEANYFFTYKCDIPILSTFYKLIPIPLVYEFLAIFILIPYCLLITALYNIVMRHKNIVIDEKVKLKFE